MLSRQHLIDPELCIRCNTCESVCKPKAITHDSRNYVVDFDKCNECGDCLPPCPTGAIDHWRNVDAPWSIEAQLAWDALPPESTSPPAGATTVAIESGPSEIPDEVRALEREAQKAQGGVAPPPWSAAHPYVGLYSRQRPAIATVTGNYRLTEASSPVDIRHIVLDFGRTAMPVLEGQSIGVLPPGRDERGNEHHIRLYSVASPRNGERPGYNNVALTVKRVTEDRDGRPARGVASNYLCDLAIGDKVSVVGPFGASFLMPNHPGAKLLMVCTGTGSAPMRAMTERRRRRIGLSEGGEILLFFGARKQEELPYFGPLKKLPKSLIDVELAFSRDERHPKSYVQDRMLAREATVGEWLASDDCFVFLCGHKRMEEGVLQAFAKIAEGKGLRWSALCEQMRAEGRFHVETY